MTNTTLPSENVCQLSRDSYGYFTLKLLGEDLDELIGVHHFAVKQGKGSHSSILVAMSKSSSGIVNKDNFVP